MHVFLKSTVLFFLFLLFCLCKTQTNSNEEEYQIIRFDNVNENNIIQNNDGVFKIKYLKKSKITENRSVKKSLSQFDKCQSACSQHVYQKNYDKINDEFIKALVKIDRMLNNSLMDILIACLCTTFFVIVFMLYRIDD